ncbi:alcohol dehydrogenase [Legionella lansingensis]|uniref:Aldehyde dehydrogenase n=1 Tax=Legionella lansingensis TaxID=45067 RepID=A0A0W0VED0_9GAMM|nr:coniferyl aldehyde dehydrogenase [Legionella lansingensis]KTD18487.1 alcohol dehydrogenase [Legionella lansingensis]SNV50141.1 alcohol dehydrogenase [Legionella lansingensis]
MELKPSFERLQQHFEREPYISCAKRKENLITLKKLLQTNAEELAQAVNDDFRHRARHETLLLEIFPVINAINYCLKHLKKWTKRRKRHVSWLFKPASAYVLPQPLGVVGIIAPWNYPIFLTAGPLIYALAAGNRVMVKMSELTPATGDLFDKFIKRSNLADSVTIVNGGVEVAREFASLPFKHLLFTGSTNVGKLVMKEAAQNLTPVTLELGGKSPVFVSTTINPEHFERLFMGKMANAGQTCVAPDYLLIPKHWESRVEKALREFIQQSYVAFPNSHDYSSIISEQHEKRLQALLNDAREKGARIVQIGEEGIQSKKVPIFLLFEPNYEMAVMKEEIFGPLLPVISYHNLQEAIDKINSLHNPLVFYYFGNDKAEKKALQEKTLSGAFVVNDTLTYLGIDDLPFGGVGYSGMGHYHGQEGFDTFSKLKPVFIQKRFAMTPWFYPPWGKLTNYLLSWVAGIHLKEKK